MKRSKLVLCVLLCCFLQLMPAYGNSNNRKEEDKDFIRTMLDNMNKTSQTGIEDFAKAINEKIYTLDVIIRLHDTLWDFFQDHENESNLLEMCILAQLETCNFLMKKDLPDKPEFLQKFYQRIFHIGKKYQTLGLSLNESEILKFPHLPKNVMYSYFGEKCCLENKKYSNYIYTAYTEKVSNTSRYIWLWHHNPTMDSLANIKVEIKGYHSTHKVHLRGTYFNTYYYIMQDNNTVAGWDKSNKDAIPATATWRIDFIDSDRVKIYQDGLIMCAAEPYYGPTRRNVRVRDISNVSSTDPECLWRLGACNF